MMSLCTQIQLDEVRNTLNKGREAFRESLVAKEKTTKDAQQEAQKTQEQLPPTTGGKESGGKKGGKGKKK